MTNKQNRTDAEGFSTKITPLGNGRFGARMYRHDRVIAEDNSAKTMAEAAKNLKELLRMADKCGSSSSMACASRDRNIRKQLALKS